MPVASSLNELKDALRTRETNITRALDDLFGDLGALSQQHRSGLQPRWVLGAKQGDPLPSWVADVLQCKVNSPVKKPLSDKEIEHLGNWPYDQKEDLKVFLLQRTQNDPPLKFHWELHSKNTEETDFTSVPNQVIFRSPQQNVSFTGVFAGVEKVAGVSVAEVRVKVGP